MRLMKLLLKNYVVYRHICLIFINVVNLIIFIVTCVLKYLGKSNIYNFNNYQILYISLDILLDHKLKPWLIEVIFLLHFKDLLLNTIVFKGKSHT